MSDPFAANRAHVVQALGLDGFVPRTEAKTPRMPTRAEVEAILPGLEIAVYNIGSETSPLSLAAYRNGEHDVSISVYRRSDSQKGVEALVNIYAGRNGPFGALRRVAGSPVDLMTTEGDRGTSATGVHGPLVVRVRTTSSTDAARIATDMLQLFFD